MDALVAVIIIVAVGATIVLDMYFSRRDNKLRLEEDEARRAESHGIATPQQHAFIVRRDALVADANINNSDQDDAFLTGMLIGAATGDPLTSGMLSGSMTGAMVGAALTSDPDDSPSQTQCDDCSCDDNSSSSSNDSSYDDSSSDSSSSDGDN